MAVERVMANSRKRRPTDAAHEDQGDEDGDQRDADGQEL